MQEAVCAMQRWTSLLTSRLLLFNFPKSGVDMMVAGSAILKEPRTMEAYKKTIDAMREELAKVKNFPILLFGKSYWAPMLAQIERMVEEGTLGRKELEFLFVADSVDEATFLLQDRLVNMWQEAQQRKDSPKWWFLEDRVRSMLRNGTGT